MPKGIPNKRYTAEFKEHVIKTMLEEKLSYTATSKRFEVNDHHRISKSENLFNHPAEQLESGIQPYSTARKNSPPPVQR